MEPLIETNFINHVVDMMISFSRVNPQYKFVDYEYHSCLFDMSNTSVIEEAPVLVFNNYACLDGEWCEMQEKMGNEIYPTLSLADSFEDYMKNNALLDKVVSASDIISECIVELLSYKGASCDFAIPLPRTNPIKIEPSSNVIDVSEDELPF